MLKGGGTRLHTIQLKDWSELQSVLVRSTRLASHRDVEATMH